MNHSEQGAKGHDERPEDDKAKNAAKTQDGARAEELTDKEIDAVHGGAAGSGGGHSFSLYGCGGGSG